jgi:hypothetical protein
MSVGKYTIVLIGQIISSNGNLWYDYVSSIIKCNSVVIKYHRGIPRWYLGQKTYFCVANEKESTFNPRAKVSNIRFIARGA